MTLGQMDAARVFTFDFPSAYRFYTEVLGFRPVVTFDGAAVFDTGPCRLILEAADAADAAERPLVGRFAGISFRVDDIAAVCRDLGDALRA